MVPSYLQDKIQGFGIMPSDLQPHLPSLPGLTYMVWQSQFTVFFTSYYDGLYFQALAHAVLSVFNVLLALVCLANSYSSFETQPGHHLLCKTFPDPSSL